jgi:DNA-binding GntR family transcriptional regulator
MSRAPAGEEAKQLTSSGDPPADAGARRQGVDQLSTQAYERIRDMIASGAFPPPSPVRESDLVRSFGMSRTPVREALHRLHAEGLIKPLPLGGYVAIELGPKDMADIYQVREILTGLAARLAAQNRTRVDIARLEDTLDAMDAAARTSDDDALDARVRDFYHILSAAGGNVYLHALIAKMVDVFRYRALAVTHPGWHAKAVRENRAIVEAIVAQDGDRAEQLTRMHMAQALAARIEGFNKKTSV